MKATRTAIDGMLIVEPTVFADERGYFMESYSRRDLDAILGTSVDFVLDSHSRSTRGVLRGLHYQLPPHAQGKLVRVAKGAVFDVAVDIRRSSPSFGRWVAVELSERNRRQVWLPPGLAHGFLVLSESADSLYKASDYYAPESERRIRWDDPVLGIAWPDVGVSPLCSERDACAPLFADATCFD